MHRAILTFAAAAMATTASPALADEAMDVDAMVEHNLPEPVNAVTPIVSGFDVENIGSSTADEFKATITSQYQSGYRLSEPVARFDNGSSAGLVSIFIPEEFAYSSTAQDTGVDNALPGRYLSNSVRSDYLSETGPITRDKSSLGIRLGF